MQQMKFNFTKREKQSCQEKDLYQKFLFLNKMLIFVKNIREMSEIKTPYFFVQLQSKKI